MQTWRNFGPKELGVRRTPRSTARDRPNGRASLAVAPAFSGRRILMATLDIPGDSSSGRFHGASENAAHGPCNLKLGLTVSCYYIVLKV